MSSTFSIDDVYDALCELGYCYSRNHFSEKWLGKSESYYRSIQVKQLEASAEAQLTLAAQLRDYGMEFGQSTDAAIAQTGQRFLEVYGKFLDTLLQRARDRALI